MSRPPRIQFEGAFYHVFNRGNRRETIFHDSKDYMVFERMLFQAARRANIILYKWHLLPNHFHLVIQTLDANLAAFMGRLLTRYALYFNRRYKLVGHVFQGRYGYRVCDKEAYFLELIRYVALQTHRSKRLASQAKHWPWSSNRFYSSGKPPEALQQGMEEVLARFGSDPQIARKRFALYLADGLTQGNWADFYKTKNNRFIGAGEFIERLKEQNGESVRRQARIMPFRNIESLMGAILKESGLPRDRLLSLRQSRDLILWRKVFVYIARTMMRTSRQALATLFLRDPSAISYIHQTASDCSRTLALCTSLLSHQTPR